MSQFQEQNYFKGLSRRASLHHAASQQSTTCNPQINLNKPVNVTVDENMFEQDLTKCSSSPLIGSQDSQGII